MLTHQKVRVYCLSVLERIWGGVDNSAQWSGADYVDNLMKTATGGVSAMGKGVTEVQFTKSKL